MTFADVIKQYFGTRRPVSDDEVSALKASLATDEWRDFVGEVRAALKKSA
ncbi:MAG TPA: hypothetical protein VD902_15995 [Symbiobacteriaceae bacterium]|nr:hypothetical protein [Symbiobacteriaceae bacterium]